MLRFPYIPFFNISKCFSTACLIETFKRAECAPLKKSNNITNHNTFLNTKNDLICLGQKTVFNRKLNFTWAKLLAWLQSESCKYNSSRFFNSNVSFWHVWWVLNFTNKCGRITVHNDVHLSKDNWKKGTDCGLSCWARTCVGVASHQSELRSRRAKFSLPNPTKF